MAQYGDQLVRVRHRHDEGTGRTFKTVELIVEDQGPGLPEQDCEAVFSRFYSARPDGEAFGTHSGLGLSISRQIVQAHGGEIIAENRVDADGSVIGARFVVRLPARSARN